MLERTEVAPVPDLEQTLTQLVASASFPALLVAGDEVLFANAAMKELFPGDPVPAPAYAGRNVSELFPWLGPLPAAPPAAPRRVQTPNFRTLLVDFCPCAAGPRWLTVIFGRLVTADEETLPELAQARELVDTVRALNESAFDGTYVTDGTGLVLGFNESFLRISGLRREELLYKQLSDLIAQKRVPVSAVAEALRTKQPVSRLVRYENGVEAMESASVVLGEDGSVFRAMANVRDVSELNRLREELRAANTLATSYRDQLRAMMGQTVELERTGLRSTAMANIYRLASKIATLDIHVLILGESGVGKDMLARFIHERSDRAGKGALVTINCGAIPEALLESELFGYEPGAFTGAQKGGKVGLFELADKGTLFLDEIGDMPLPLQVKLLTVLQEGRLYRVGGTRIVHIDTRIIAATNADLDQLVGEGRFRKDLYYRLNVLPIQIPPLRERRDDIVPLALTFLDEFSRKYGMPKTFAPETLERLAAYPWPGNVRELRNAVERLLVTADGSRIGPDCLPPQLLKAATAPDPAMGGAATLDAGTLAEQMDRYERHLLAAALKSHRTLRACADVLGIDVSTLVRKKRRHGV